MCLDMTLGVVLHQAVSRGRPRLLSATHWNGGGGVAPTALGAAGAFGWRRVGAKV